MKLSSEKNSAEVHGIIAGTKNPGSIDALLRPYVVAEHFSPSTRETYLELESSDQDDLFQWLSNHRDAVLVRVT